MNLTPAPGYLAAGCVKGAPGLVSIHLPDYIDPRRGWRVWPPRFESSELVEFMMKNDAQSALVTVALSSVPRPHDDVALQRVAGRFMAATPDDRLHTFEGPDDASSAVAERVIELIDGRRTVADIVHFIFDEFDVAPETAARDITQFIGLLVSKNVLVLS